MDPQSQGGICFTRDQDGSNPNFQPDDYVYEEFRGSSKN